MPSCLTYLSISGMKSKMLPNGNIQILSTITNAATSPVAAFAIRVQPMDAATNEQILPAIISDSYFSLMRGESRKVIVEFSPKQVTDETFAIKFTPYNGSNEEKNYLMSPVMKIVRNQ